MQFLYDLDNCVNTFTLKIVCSHIRYLTGRD